MKLITLSLLLFVAVNSNVSYGSNYKQSIQSWCQDQLRVLKRAHYKAEKHMDYGRYELASNSLIQGLQNSLENIEPYYNSTFTSKAIQRGLKLAQKIVEQREENQLYQRTLNYFLFEYYEFISFASKKLDLKFAQSRNCHFCGLFGNSRFEKNYVKFAKWQLKMVMDRLATKSVEGNITHYYPLGVPNVFLSVFGETTGFIIKDLEDSVFATQLACTIDELYYVGDRIKNYSSDFFNYYEAVQFAGHSADKILNEFNCSSRFPGKRSSERTTFDALSGSSLTLYSGTTKTVYLDEFTAMKKLIISAEGVGEDAMFNVVVNGEVKGTIYVPGRDPSYHVTIEDSASQIELVSLYGKARISRILVTIYPSY